MCSGTIHNSEAQLLFPQPDLGLLGRFPRCDSSFRAVPVPAAGRWSCAVSSSCPRTAVLRKEEAFMPPVLCSRTAPTAPPPPIAKGQASPQTWKPGSPAFAVGVGVGGLPRHVV